MTWLAGVDGCRAGWFRACRETATGELRFDVLQTATDLVRTEPHPEVVALDIPIGLPESGSRDCDLAARRVLGPRRSSVFPAPVRAALASASREEASRITSEIDGRKVGTQAWAIYGKIQEVDEALRADARLRRSVREVHPEVCFWAWNGSQPMRWPKKRKAGNKERSLLAEHWLGSNVLVRARGSHPKKDLADDDVLDSIAGLWTAHRIESGAYRTFPEIPPRDGAGLPMEIVY